MPPQSVSAATTENIIKDDRFVCGIKVPQSFHHSSHCRAKSGDEKFFHRDGSFIGFYHFVVPYLITLSARASTLGGMVKPICLAAFRLMMNSNFLGCSTGRSAGLAPLRILST